MGVEVSLCQFDGFANADADDDPLEAELMSLLKCLTDKVAIVNDAQVGVALSESLFAQLSRHYAYGSSPNGTRHFEFPTDAVNEGLVAQRGDDARSAYDAYAVDHTHLGIESLLCQEPTVLNTYHDL